MAGPAVSGIHIRISPDNMAAFLTLNPPEDLETGYTMEEVKEAMDNCGVTFGVTEAIVSEMVANRIYLVERQIAMGKEPGESFDGYFTYHFEKEVDNKPKVLEDGSVDYWNCNVITMVDKDDVIAEYTPAVQGEPGMNVRGIIVPPKRGKEQMPLKGKGFTRSEDGLTYTADLTGKIEEIGGRVMVSNVYEVRGDVDVSIGNIDFNGDVVIHGAVRDGIVIKATGTVTVDGIVEGAFIEAGGDIVFKSGLIGNSKAEIYTKGNIIAKFIEFAQVNCEGNIQAESFLDSDVRSNSEIKLEGKKSKIIGGFTCAVEGITAYDIGNQVGVMTMVKVGFDSDMRHRMEELKEKISSTETNLARVEQGLSILDMQSKTGGASVQEIQSRKMQLLRVKIRDSSVVSADRMELEHLESLLVRSKNTKIRVDGTIYGGTRIMINDYISEIKTKDVLVSYIANDEEACITAFRTY